MLGNEHLLKNIKNRLLLGKFRILRTIGEGSFGKIFEGENAKTGEKVALKLERIKYSNLLVNESNLLSILGGIGVPKVISFGNTYKFNILVETLVGESLDKMYNLNQFSMKDVCLLGMQILERISYIHSKGIIHRDIKPDNFAIGRENKNYIYVLDFGLSYKYINEKGEHRPFIITKKLTGTARFASKNALRGYEQSRRDDLESICYLLIFFLKGRLPWQGINAKTKQEKYYKIYQLKKYLKPSEICQNLPYEFETMLEYTKFLDFYEKPNYEYLINLLVSLFKNIGFTNYNFSWNENHSNTPEKTIQKIYKKILPINLNKKKKRNIASLERKKDETIKNNNNFTNIKNEKTEFDFGKIHEKMQETKKNKDLINKSKIKNLNTTLIKRIKVDLDKLNFNTSSNKKDGDHSPSNSVSLRVREKSTQENDKKYSKINPTLEINKKVDNYLTTLVNNTQGNHKNRNFNAFLEEDKHMKTEGEPYTERKINRNQLIMQIDGIDRETAKRNDSLEPEIDHLLSFYNNKKNSVDNGRRKIIKKLIEIPEMFIGSDIIKVNESSSKDINKSKVNNNKYVNINYKNNIKNIKKENIKTARNNSIRTKLSFNSNLKKSKNYAMSPISNRIITTNNDTKEFIRHCYNKSSLTQRYNGRETKITNNINNILNVNINNINGFTGLSGLGSLENLHIGENSNNTNCNIVYINNDNNRLNNLRKYNTKTNNNDFNNNNNNTKFNSKTNDTFTNKFIDCISFIRKKVITDRNNGGNKSVTKRDKIKTSGINIINNISSYKYNINTNNYNTEIIPKLNLKKINIKDNLMGKKAINNKFAKIISLDESGYK